MVNSIELCTNKLYNLADNIINIAKDLKYGEFLKKINNDESSPEPPVNAKIAGAVMRYIADGYSPDNACILTAGDYAETFKRVRAIYDANRIASTPFRYCEKYFFCKQLQKKGFKVAEIANMLDVSDTTVYKYLKGKKS